MTGRLGFDVAPAQQQNFVSPALDLARFGLRALLGPGPAFLALMAAPQALAATIAYRITWLVTPGEGAWRSAAAIAATALGATGAAGLATVGASIGEMPDGALVLYAALLLIRAPPRPAAATLLAAGACLGAAAGLRLPALPLCLGVLAAYAACAASRPRARLRDLAVLAFASLAGFAAVAGPWQAALAWRHGSPLFPYYNDFFRSPDIPPVRLADRRFLPEGALGAIFYPFQWALDRRPVVSEHFLRDPRFALAWCGVVLGTLRARSRAAWFLIVLFAAAYALWTFQFGVLRYLAPLELLTGAALLLPLSGFSARAAVFIVLAAGALSAATTVYPDWGHAVPRGAAPRVQPPDFEDGSLVLLLDGSPMAYVATFANPRARFAGANDNLVSLGQDGRLAREIEASVRGHDGPLWGLEDPVERPGEGDATLAYYGLVRAPGCARVPSNLDSDAIIACRLLRAPAPPER